MYYMIITSNCQPYLKLTTINTYVIICIVGVNMEHYKLVLPEHMNHYNNLFGGYLLKWIDEFSYITVNLDYPNHNFVTISLNNVEFKHNIKSGNILCFDITNIKKGNTSVQYKINVYKEKDKEKILFQTDITFVNIDNLGKKKIL